MHWTPWFAWRPVWLTKTGETVIRECQFKPGGSYVGDVIEATPALVWLRTIERRLHPCAIGWRIWEYRK